jgi:hypothetical protein
MSLNYESQLTYSSAKFDGVQYTINRMSFGRRVELIRRIKDLVGRMEYFEAGATSAEKVEASLLSAEIDRFYLEWGLTKVSGILIDGAEPTVASLVESAPESLCEEILASIKAECGLSDEERKN